jgi:cytochrome c oxidase subunit IV
MAKDDDKLSDPETETETEDTETEDTEGEDTSDGSDESDEDDDDEGSDEDDDDDESDEDDEEAHAGAASTPPPSGTPALAHAGAHGHDDHGLAHVMPQPLLFGILGVLLVLTVITVAVTSVDLGSAGNLWVAMIIATIKAGLVCAFFMHLRWDNKFHLVLFLGSLLFLILFLSGAITDRGEYEQDIQFYTSQVK